MPKPFKWHKVWCVQADHDQCKVGDVITVQSASNGPKNVKVTDIVVKVARNGEPYDLLFTEDV